MFPFILDEYIRLTGEEIPYLRLGYHSLFHLLRDIPEIISSRNDANEPVLVVKPNSKTQHLHELIQKQKDPKTFRVILFRLLLFSFFYSILSNPEYLLFIRGNPEEALMTENAIVIKDKKSVGRHTIRIDRFRPLKKPPKKRYKNRQRTKIIDVL